ncbi:MAG: diacylglycerol kinase family lipid kinase [Clostridia bacterium]|nr:diacylglycerol kinase family lipid kinase [Clostridia bacterium]
MEKEILIIVNPNAGKGKVNKYIPEICDNLEKQGYELEVVYTSENNDGEKIIQSYVRYIDAVIVCGGDGTLSQVINGVIKSYKKIDVTFVPFGTTNDFYKTVKLPKNKYKLSKKISNFNAIDVDIGKFNDKYFFYIAAFGMCTDISYLTPQEEKNKIGKFAYYKKAFKVLKKVKKYRPIQTTIVTDDEIIKGKFIYGGVSNSISIGGVKWFKRNDVNVDDGKFEVVLIKKPKNFMELIKIAISVLRKKYDSQYIYYLKTTHFQADFDYDVDWTLDGEYGGKANHVLIENNKGKLGFLVPKKGGKNEK